MLDDIYSGFLLCPDCNQMAEISFKIIDSSPAAMLDHHRNMNTDKLKHISNKTGVPLKTLFAEAAEASKSLETALTVIESKYNICPVCGSLRQ
jgi:microsomal dipeptidase-like Zn-dependent dipeptidase